MSKYQFITPIELVLSSEDKSVLPYLPTYSSLRYGLDHKRNRYHNLIRMNNSDRNKAKATIEILDKVFYLSEHILQLFNALFKEQIDGLAGDEYARLEATNVALFDENRTAFNEHFVPLKGHPRPTDGYEFVAKLGDIIYNTLNTSFAYEIDSPIFTLSDAIDLIIYGESRKYSETIKGYNSTKLISDYISHLENVAGYLSNKGMSYLTPIVTELKKKGNK